MKSDAQLAKSIFDRALELDSENERRELIDRECSGNTSLRTKVENLLVASERAESFLELPPLGIATSEEQTDQQGADQLVEIGPYKIREQIGEGGMGVVYVAEQTEPVQRKVALKIIKPGMDTKEVIARFEAERQALAFMEHPNIAHVLDAGATESGRSYFVMELVRGIPITEYCDQAKATPRERLELFQTVCDAVQHAHQKGIIHRDIKPSNVLVTQVSAKPVVKVIDFGLAKAVSGQRLTEKTLYTGFMKLMGTPAYMSPEQAGLSGLDIDTRSDIYSLGVLLYELLTGTTPLDKAEIQKQAYDELCRQIREVDAPKPSTRFSTLKDAVRSTVAERRRIEPRELGLLLDGDLDRVVLKAIQKDRDRRYASPQDLAADVERFLADKPVLAVSPSPTYLAGKYVRRHKTAFLAAATVLLTMIIATGVSSWQAIRATRFSRIAEERTNAATRSERTAIDAQQKTQAALKEAETAKLSAEKSRNRVRLESEQRRQLLYAANLQMADQIWHSSHRKPEEIQNLLVDWIHSEPDLRDFAWRYQWTRLHHGSAQTVMDADAVTLSPQGDLIFSNDHGIHRWDRSTKQFVDMVDPNVLFTHARWPEYTLSPCGRWAALRPPLWDKPMETATVRLIDMSKGTLVRELPGNQATFSPDGSLAFTWRRGDRPGPWQKFLPVKQDFASAVLWDLTTDKETSLPAYVRAMLPASNLPWQVISVSSDGQSFVCAHGAELRAFLHGEPFLHHYSTEVQVTAFSLDGELMADGVLNGDVHVRSTKRPHLSLLIEPPHTWFPASIAFSSDSQSLAIGGLDGTIDIWDVSSVHELATTHEVTNSTAKPAVTQKAPASNLVRSLKGHIHPVDSLVFARDGSRIISLGRDGTAKAWDLTESVEETTTADSLFQSTPGITVDSDGRSVRLRDLEFEDGSAIRPGDRIVGVTNEQGFHDFGAESHQAADAEAVSRLLAGPHDSEVKLHLATVEGNRHEIRLKRTSRMAPVARAVGYAEDGRSIFVADPRTGATLFDAAGVPQQRLPIRSSSLAFSPDGQLLAMDDYDQIVLWNVRKDEPFARWNARHGEFDVTVSDWYGNLAFSPDGKLLAVGTGYRNHQVARRSDLRVWEVATGAEISKAPLSEADTVFCSVAFTQDGKSLIAASHDQSVRIWDTATWSLERAFKVPTAILITSMALSPDERTIALGGGGLAIYELDSGKALHVRRALNISDLAFATDSKTLVATKGDGRVIMLDVESGRQITTLLEHAVAVTGGDFSPDGNTLATIDLHGNLRLWEAMSLAEIDRQPSTHRALYQRVVSLTEEERHAEAASILRHLLKLQRQYLPPGSRGTIKSGVRDVDETKSQLIATLNRLGEYPTITHQPKSQRVDLGASVTLSVECNNKAQNAYSYQWFFSGEAIADATQSSLTIVNLDQSDLGAYHVEVYYDPDLKLTVKSDTAFIVDDANPVAKGLRKEFFGNIEGNKVADLLASPKYPDHPDTRGAVSTFELPPSADDNYGVRFTGFIVPPKTGEYIFYLCSDDSSELFLSTDESPENKRSIAWLNEWHTSREWESLRPENISKPQSLVAGKRYWVEALFKERSRVDQFSVTWQIPGKPPPKNGDPPIPGEYLEFRVD